MYRTALFRYAAGTAPGLGPGVGSLKRITFSATARSLPSSGIIVSFRPIVGPPFAITRLNSCWGITQFCNSTFGKYRRPPSGYLFICPVNDLRNGPASFRWPNCPAYWSLDPGGVQCLSTDEATRAGYPTIQLTTEVRGWSWNASVDSQDVARHFGYPLFQLSTQANPLVAHGKFKLCLHLPVVPHNNK
jgi:hypothetical protein